MSNFIFIVNDILGEENTKISATTIAKTLLTAGIWIYRDNSPNLKWIKDNDKILIYLCGPGRRHFVASVQVIEEAKLFRDKSIVLDEAVYSIATQLGLRWMSLYTKVEVEKVFKEPVEIQPLVDRLQFIKDKKNYGLHLRLPIVKISDEDFNLILHESE